MSALQMGKVGSRSLRHHSSLYPLAAEGAASTFRFVTPQILGTITHGRHLPHLPVWLGRKHAGGTLSAIWWGHLSLKECRELLGWLVSGWLYKLIPYEMLPGKDLECQGEM